MRTVLLLLVALLCLEGAWTLKCHMCEAVGDTCSNPVQCPSGMQACALLRGKIREEFNESSIVMKTCLSTCVSSPPSKANIKEVELYYRCCTSDLCNAAPGQGLGAATVGMMLLAPVLAALLGDIL